MSVVTFIKRTLRRYTDIIAVRNFEQVAFEQDNTQPFTKDIAREEKDLNGYLDAISLPKDLY